MTAKKRRSVEFDIETLQSIEIEQGVPLVPAKRGTTAGDTSSILSRTCTNLLTNMRVGDSVVIPRDDRLQQVMSSAAKRLKRRIAFRSISDTETRVYRTN